MYTQVGKNGKKSTVTTKLQHKFQLTAPFNQRVNQMKMYYYGRVTTLSLWVNAIRFAFSIVNTFFNCKWRSVSDRYSSPHCPMLIGWNSLSLEAFSSWCSIHWYCFVFNHKREQILFHYIRDYAARSFQTEAMC